MNDEAKERRVAGYMRCVEQHGAEKVVRLLLEMLDKQREILTAAHGERVAGAKGEGAGK